MTLAAREAFGVRVASAPLFGKPLKTNCNSKGLWVELRVREKGFELSSTLGNIRAAPARYSVAIFSLISAIACRACVKSTRLVRAELVLGVPADE